MTDKECNDLFKELVLDVFFKIYLLTNEQRVFFLRWVEKLEDHDFDSGSMKRFILDQVNKFNNEGFDEVKEKIQQLKLF